MKRSILVLLAIAAALTFSNCKKDEDSNGAAKATTTLSGEIKSKESLEGKTIELKNSYEQTFTVWASGKIGAKNTFSIDLSNLSVGETVDYSRVFFRLWPNDEPEVGKNAKMNDLKLIVNNRPLRAVNDKEEGGFIDLVYSDQEFKLVKKLDHHTWNIHLMQGVNVVVSKVLEGGIRTFESSPSIPSGWYWTMD